MQAVSGELAEILASRLQAGPSAFHGRVVLAAACPAPVIAQTAVGDSGLTGSGVTVTLGAAPTPGNILLMFWWKDDATSSPSPTPAFTQDAAGYGHDATQYGGPGNAARLVLLSRVVQPGDGAAVSLGGQAGFQSAALVEVAGAVWPPSVVTDTATLTGASTLTLTGAAAGVNTVVAAWAMQRTTYAPADSVAPSGGAVEIYDRDPAYYHAPHEWLAYQSGSGAVSVSGSPDANPNLNKWGVFAAAYVLSAAIVTHSYQPLRIDIDQSMGMAAGQMSAEFANEGLPLGWGLTGVFPTGARIRAYQWYGGEASSVCTFTGLIDRVTDGRDPLSTALACRDMMALLIDTTFSASAPQGADEAGAVRTEDNGVYLGREASYIVADILDRWGWPAADRAITPTSYTLAEYAIADGESGAGAVIGDDRLTGLTGYDAWADELGVFHFAPAADESPLTDPPAPAWTFRAGVDITSLSEDTSLYDLRTRVKVRGPLTTETLTDTWREQWRTSKISRPAGIWHDPADAANLRVLDRGTRRLYKVRQSDRRVLSSVYLGGAVPHPLGVSGDPSDAAVYWVLDAPWLWGSGSASSVKRIRKADNAVLATYALDTDHWSSVKVSGAYIYAANLTDDRVHRRSKADGSAVDSFRHTYRSAAQSNPSGLMVDGTTVSVMWSNSGTTARFLVCDESAPGTVTGVVKTAGTVLVGGEMDTVTHAACWGGSDSLGRVAKFTLADVSSTTSQVYAEEVDTVLEDELGVLAQVEWRLHGSGCPADEIVGAHAWLARRETVTLDTVVSLAQATETAMRRLDRLARRSRVLDAGILGNPAIQKSDTVRIEDPVTGIAEDWRIDTHRSGMSAGGTYTGTLALLPVAAPTDVVADDGSAS